MAILFGRAESRRYRRLDDSRLAALVHRGDDGAFEELYDRHHGSLLAFCRHTLGNREDGEDALQQTFLRAHGALRKHGPPDSVRPWLFAIARNRCRTLVAARRDTVATHEEFEPSFSGLADDVRRRADLRELVGDLARLPEDQRSALVLFELGGFSQAEIASVIGCAPGKVKALVFQARTALIADRDARNASCEDIRGQLEGARAGALRRGPLRRHLRQCEPCQAYRHAIARQRSALALILPVAPAAGLKATLLGAVEASASGGVAAAGGASAMGGGASAVGGASATGGAAAAAGGLAAKALVAKVAVTVAVTGAGVTGGIAAVEDHGGRDTVADRGARPTLQGAPAADPAPAPDPDGAPVSDAGPAPVPAEDFAQTSAGRVRAGGLTPAGAFRISERRLQARPLRSALGLPAIGPPRRRARAALLRRVLGPRARRIAARRLSDAGPRRRRRLFRRVLLRGRRLGATEPRIRRGTALDAPPTESTPVVRPHRRLRRVLGVQLDTSPGIRPRRRVQAPEAEPAPAPIPAPESDATITPSAAPEDGADLTEAPPASPAPTPAAPVAPAP